MQDGTKTIINKGSVETRSQENLRSNSTTNPGAWIRLKDCTLKYSGRLKEFFYHFDSPKNQLIFTIRWLGCACRDVLWSFKYCFEIKFRDYLLTVVNFRSGKNWTGVAKMRTNKYCGKRTCAFTRGCSARVWSWSSRNARVLLWRITHARRHCSSSDLNLCRVARRLPEEKLTVWVWWNVKSLPNF